MKHEPRPRTQPALGAIPHRRYQRPAQSTAWPWGLSGSVVLILFVETWLATLGPRLQDPVCFSWAFSAREAVESAPGRAILCLGDSLAKHGLAPRLIEQSTGLKTYNLAVAAGPAPITEILLNRALDAGARPRAILLEFKPSLLAGGPRYRMREWQEVPSIRELASLIAESGSSRFATELILGALSPSYRGRHETRAALLELARGEGSRLSALNAICARNWSVNLGANLATPNPGFDGKVSEAQHQDALSHRFSVHRQNAAAARRVLETAATHKIAVYLVLPPLCPELTTRREQTGADRKYDEFMRSLQASGNRVTVLDARKSGYPASAFIDPMHLDARGAARLSLDVAEVLNHDAREPEPVKPDRWIALPAFRPVDADLKFEDVESSREHLGIPVLR